MATAEHRLDQGRAHRPWCAEPTIDQMVAMIGAPRQPLSADDVVRVRRSLHYVYQCTDWDGRWSTLAEAHKQYVLAMIDKGRRDRATA